MKKGCETPCTHKVLCSLTKLALEEPPAIHVLIAWSPLCFTGSHTSKPGVSPCSCGGFQRTPWNQRSSRPEDSPDLYFLRSWNQTSAGLAECVHQRGAGGHGTTNHHNLPKEGWSSATPRRNRPRRIPAALPAHTRAVCCGLWQVFCRNSGAQPPWEPPQAAVLRAGSWTGQESTGLGFLELSLHTQQTAAQTGHSGPGVCRTIPEKALGSSQLGGKFQTPVCDRCWHYIFAAEGAFGSLGANLKFTPPWPLFIQLCCSAALSVPLHHERILGVLQLWAPHRSFSIFYPQDSKPKYVSKRLHHSQAEMGKDLSLWATGTHSSDQGDGKKPVT